MPRQTPTTLQRLGSLRFVSDSGLPTAGKNCSPQHLKLDAIDSVVKMRDAPPGCLPVSCLPSANFHEGIVGQPTKVFTHEHWMHQKDVQADMKKAYEPARMEDISQNLVDPNLLILK